MQARSSTLAGFIVPLGFLVAPVPVVAQTPASSSPDCNATSTIFYANGVGNDFAQAVASAEKLQMALEGQMTEEERRTTSFEIAYNQTAGYTQDVWEAVRQRFASDNLRLSQFLLALSGYFPLPDAARTALVEEMARRTTRERVTSADVGKHVALYKNAIGSGKKVMVVAHSQGNFFVNLAYPSLTADERRSLRVVSAANPDIAVAGGGPYTTLFTDLVIGAVTAFSVTTGRLVLPPNTLGTVPGFDFGHGFAQSYLRAGSASFDRLLTTSLAQLRAAEAPAQVFGRGAIRATLTWGNQPDVDLHVYEPNGAHVFYQARRGPSGELDVDDTDSLGPENYFVGCSTVEAGLYRVGVNYFRGSGPETARVELRAGGLSDQVITTLPAARGASGDQSPVIVATVRVTRDANGRYTYAIGR